MALLFDRSFDPPVGEPVTVAAGVRRVSAGNAGPFTFRGTNSFLIGHGPVAVLDPGPADPAHLEALVAAIGDARVTHILVSHRHADHSAGARPLQERTGAPILAARARGELRPDSGPKVRLDADAESGFVPNDFLAGGDFIDIGDHRLAAIATPGHASDHLAFALDGSGVLFSGDHVMGWSTTVVAPPDGAMADYMASLDRLLERPEQHYLPAHGREIREAHAYVRALRAHRRMREAAIVEAVRRKESTIREIVASVYPALDPQLTAAAGLSVLAHLDDLEARGIVQAADAPPLLRRYRAATAGLD